MTHITLPRAVAEQALEALEDAARCVQENYLPDQCGHDWDEQITALRAALAQQAEAGEPVAWVRLEAWKSGKDWPDDCFTALPAEGLTPLCKCADTPPQRKPLTDEEIAAEWRKASEFAGKSEGAVTTSQFVQIFARAVERAHGIGEGS